MQQINQLRELVLNSDNIVFFGGAGVSTESNIPDFRSENGMYNNTAFEYPPEKILSKEYFKKHTQKFFEFYKNNMIFDNIKPNKAHIALARLEAEGKLKATITQNIDGLHQLAGGRRILELHGSIHRNYCMNCEKSYTLQQVKESQQVIPTCSCGGVIKPAVTLYGENLNMGTLNLCIEAMRGADLVIVGGTSLSVYPAADLLNYYNGDNIVIINKDATPFDNMASLVIRQSIGEVLEQAVL